MIIEISPEWRRRVKRLLPTLQEGVSLEFTSEVDYNYNCLSWALGCNAVPFENSRGAFWPWKNIPDDTADGWTQLCRYHGFTESDNSDFVSGYEKIAIFENDDGELHAARQSREGRWKSKLGDMGPDIDHDGLEGLKPTTVRLIVEQNQLVRVIE